jgi:hypothetical protein
VKHAFDKMLPLSPANAKSVRRNLPYGVK